MRCTKDLHVTVLSNLEGGAPHIEQTFGVGVRFNSDFGQLFVDAACDGTVLPQSVCVRQPGGTWKTVSMSSHQPTKPPAGSAVDKPRPAYPTDAAGKYQTVTTFDQDGTGKWVVFAIVAHRTQSC